MEGRRPALAGGPAAAVQQTKSGVVLAPFLEISFVEQAAIPQTVRGKAAAVVFNRLLRRPRLAEAA